MDGLLTSALNTSSLYAGGLLFGIGLIILVLVWNQNCTKVNFGKRRFA